MGAYVFFFFKYYGKLFYSEANKIDFHDLKKDYNFSDPGMKGITIQTVFFLYILVLMRCL